MRPPRRTYSIPASLGQNYDIVQPLPGSLITEVVERQHRMDILLAHTVLFDALGHPMIVGQDRGYSEETVFTEHALGFRTTESSGSLRLSDLQNAMRTIREYRRPRTISPPELPGWTITLVDDLPVDWAFIITPRRDPFFPEFPDHLRFVGPEDQQTPLANDTVETLLDLAREGREEDFRFLAGANGVNAEDLDEMWAGTRKRLGFKDEPVAFAPTAAQEAFLANPEPQIDSGFR